MFEQSTRNEMKKYKIVISRWCKRESWIVKLTRYHEKYCHANYPKTKKHIWYIGNRDTSIKNLCLPSLSVCIRLSRSSQSSLSRHHHFLPCIKLFSPLYLITKITTSKSWFGRHEIIKREKRKRRKSSAGSRAVWFPGFGCSVFAFGLQCFVFQI